MRRTIRVGLALGLLALLGPATAADPAIKLKSVKYDDLTKEIRTHKGKIVVVDIWAEY
jgi:hypothetical protein